MKGRLVITMAAMALAAGTVFVAAEGTGPAPAQPGAEPKAGTQPQPKAADPKAKNGKDKGTQAQPKEKVEPKAKNGGPTQPKTGEKSAPKADPKAAEKPPAGTTTTITTEQRTEIRQTIVKQGNAPRVTNVNFTVSVGTVVPGTVTLVVLPPRVVEIYPAWRGYRYFLVGDRIIIVDGNMRIVAIIDA